MAQQREKDAVALIRALHDVSVVTVRSNDDESITWFFDLRYYVKLHSHSKLRWSLDREKFCISQYLLAVELLLPKLLDLLGPTRLRLLVL